MGSKALVYLFSLAIGLRGTKNWGKVQSWTDGKCPATTHWERYDLCLTQSPKGFYGIWRCCACRVWQLEGLWKDGLGPINVHICWTYPQWPELCHEMQILESFDEIQSNNSPRLIWHMQPKRAATHEYCIYYFGSKMTSKNVLSHEVLYLIIYTILCLFKFIWKSNDFKCAHKRRHILQSCVWNGKF